MEAANLLLEVHETLASKGKKHVFYLSAIKDGLNIRRVFRRDVSRGHTPSTLSPTRLEAPHPETSIKSFQERLWNEAYGGVKVKESRILSRRIIILSLELREDDPTVTDWTTPAKNTIALDRRNHSREIGRTIISDKLIACYVIAKRSLSVLRNFATNGQFGCGSIEW